MQKHLRNVQRGFKGEIFKRSSSLGRLEERSLEGGEVGNLEDAMVIVVCL